MSEKMSESKTGLFELELKPRRRAEDQRQHPKLKTPDRKYTPRKVMAQFGRFLARIVDLRFRISEARWGLYIG